MRAKLLDGRRIGEAVKQRVANKIEQRLQAGKAAPGLAVILVGDNPASATYVKHKQRACAEVGIVSHCHQLSADTTQQALLDFIKQLNEDAQTQGILLQLPLPAHINADDLLEAIDPHKDVDGFHPYNLGRLTQRRPLIRPCTPYGVMTLLKSTQENLVGKYAVVVGASNIVGRPMALELLLAKCTVTVCHRFTQNLATHIGLADILISATGKPGIIQSQWIKPGAIVIDVGFSRLSNGVITGDLEFDSAAEIASWITPVPGGVGPMTVATLVENTLLATELYE